MKQYGFKSKYYSLLLLATLLLALIPGGVAHGAGGARHAKPSASGTGDCYSWANACTLQTALIGAISGDEIWVMAGTHRPTMGTNRSATFQLKSGVAVYGGFNGTETSLSQRNPADNVTILSGSLSAGNSYHVVTGTSGATLDGFTITSGAADGPGTNERGAGMYNPFGSSPTLKNLIFSGNSANWAGGGMFNNVNSNPTLTNVTFSGNSVTGNGGGGGMFNYTGSPTLTNVTFSGNSSNDSGGGMYNYSSSNPILMNVTFSGNSANDKGGGMYNASGSSPTIRNTIFWGNTATTAGAQVYNNSSTPYVNYSVLQGGCPTGSTCIFPIIMTDPMLGTLGNNGGSTLTIPLLAGSSAIDSGSDAGCPDTDQRGMARPQGAHCDIGAYESDSIATPLPPVVTASDGADLNGVNVSWTASGGATSYLAYRSESLTGTKLPPNGVAISGLGGADLTSGPGVDYYYWVKACNAGGCSDFSAADIGWRALTPPVVTASDGTFPDKVQVSWNAVSGAIGYIAYRSDSPSGVKIPESGISTTGLGGPDASAQAGVTYYYWVLACSQMHCSNFSAAETGWR